MNTKRLSWILLLFTPVLAGCLAPPPFGTLSAQTAIVAPTSPTAAEPPNVGVQTQTASELIHPTPRVVGPDVMQSVLMSTYTDPAMRDFIEKKFRSYTIANCVDRDFSGEGWIDRVCGRSPGLHEPYTEAHADVDGDSEIETIVAVDFGLFVLKWEQGAYRRIGEVGVGLSRLTADVAVRFEDWTGDGRPDIVFDASTTGGGTNQFSESLERTILSCQVDRCWLAWNAPVSSYWADSSSGGFSRGTTDITLIIGAEAGAVKIRARGSRYDLECCTYGEGFPIEHPITVYTETETIYSLNALGVFEPIEQRDLVPIAYPTYPATHDVSDRMHNRAVLEWVEGRANDSCLVRLDGAPVDDSFGCRSDLTRLWWQDVDGDNIEDLVVVAYEPEQVDYRADLGKQTGTPEWNTEGYSCVGQHMKVYSLTSKPIDILADVRGCIVDPYTLYGVRIEDVDGDGQVEITAARGGDQPGVQAGTEVYRWNASTFQFSLATQP